MPDTASLYDRDWFAWAQDQAARRRELRPNGPDCENLAEEIEDIGESQRCAVESLLTQIVAQFLKSEFHPMPDAVRHWRAEIDAFRVALDRELRDSPSLHARGADLFRTARHGAARVLRRQWRNFHAEVLPLGAVGPDSSGYDLDTQVLAESWFPAPPDDAGMATAPDAG